MNHPGLTKLSKTSLALKLLNEMGDEASNQRRLIQLICYHNFELFVRIFFNHHCGYPFSQMHRDFFQDEVNPARRGRREVIAAPRGHAKTTFKVIFKVLHAIVYGYERFILIIGHSAPEAEAKVKDILGELENNALLKAVYGSLAPVKGKMGWSTKNFVTQNGIRVMAKSRGKQVRGLKHGQSRPTLIILDDIESPDKVLTETQRYKTRQWLEKDILKLGSVDGKANIMIIGTCLHPEALLPELLASFGWQGRKYQAVKRFSDGEGLWQQWKAIYTELGNPNRETDAQVFYEANQESMLSGTEVLWPEAESYLHLMQIKINEGQASFQSEKQNDPYDPERQIFNMEQAKRFKLVYDPGGEWIGFQFLDDSQRFVPKEHLIRLVAFHDPAMAESRDSDYAAIVVCASDCNGYLYCMDAWIEKVPPSRQIEQALSLHKKWNLDVLYLESNNFQGILQENYRVAQEDGQTLRVKAVTQHTNKEKRIASLEPLVSNGQLLFADTLNPRLMSQMSLFPTSHDDGPDALYGAVDPLWKRAGRAFQK